MMDGLPLGHHGLSSLQSEYNYHQVMAQHAAAVSATNNSGLHAGNMGQLSMMPAGLNLSMNANNQSMANLSASLGSGHHMSHGQMGGNSMQSCGTGGGGGGKAKNKKPKVNKDGVPAPKRATTAYINFTQWYREDQKKNGRQIPKIGEFGKECAGKWNNMTSEEKQPFLEIAAQDRERYKKEMAIFKPARDVNKPKRPGTAFMLFMGDLRKEMAGKEPEGGVAALAKLGGERWRGMTDDDKRQYIEKQGEEKVRYEANMEEYRKKQSVLNMPPAAKQPRLEEPSQDSSDSSELPASSTAIATSVVQIPQLTQNVSNSNSSSPSRSNANTPASQVSSASPPPPTLSPGPNAAIGTNAAASPSSSSSSSSMSALSSLASPLSLTQAMAMGYAQHTLTNFAHASGMLVANPTFNQPHAAHNTTLTSTPYLPAAGNNYSNQPHMPGPYTWN